MVVIPILSVSILLQFTTAYLSFKLIKVTGKTYSWVLISIAFCLMGLRRLITLIYSILIPPKYSPNLNSEIVALVIALLMLTGVLLIRPFFIKRRQAEEAVERTAYEWEATFDATNSAVWILDRFQKVQRSNKTSERIFGIQVKDFIGKFCWEIVHGTDHPIEDCPAVRAIKSLRRETMELQVKEHWFEVVVDPILEANGIYSGAVHIVTDVTERKQTEEELEKYREHLEELVKERTAELEKINFNLQDEIAERIRIENELANGRNMLRTLIDSMQEEVYAKDIESRYILANSRLLSSFGLNEFNEIIGKTDFNFLPQNEAMENYRDENAVLKAKGQIIYFEKIVTVSEGKTRWYGITKVPMRDKDGNITGLVGIKRDITDHKEAEENLQEAKEAAEIANRAKSAFLSNMSHEIRTPLNAIMGFSELMLNDKNLTEEQNAWLNTINKSGEHLLAIINDILEISKIEAGRVTFNPSTFDLQDMLKDIETMFRVKTEIKKLAFFVELSDDLPKYVVADEAKLRQIFINTVGNAVKFTDEGGIVVRVRTMEAANGKMKLMAEVEDTGPGIAEKEIEQLFQMFGQTKTGIKEGGTGLGLAISQEYANIMNGSITVKSEPDKGTCFTINVEIGQGEKQSKNDSVKRRITGLKDGEYCRVLVVDDRENNRDLLREMLLSVGFEVEEAKDGLEAIKKFKAMLPDIILMDMRMPVMNGYDSIKSLKSMNSPDDKKVPIIAVTASAFSEDRKKALDAGADLYLRKPFKEQELFESIGYCLDLQYVYE